jgi:FKBP-type peptidyl-prolyl cis-trans isomerase
MLSSKRNAVSFIACALALFTFFGCSGSNGQIESSDISDPQNDNEKISYSIGYNIGGNFHSQQIDSLNLQQIMKGIKDGMEDSEPAISDSAMGAMMRSFQQRVMSQQKQRSKQQAQSNKQKADAFLAENKKKEGVMTTESGLQYKILDEGSGPSPGSNDTVRVHYKGTLIDGTVFDSSYKRGEPTEFPVGGVIEGWTEALKMMKEGAKWKLFIPPELGYGQRDPRGAIGPNETLIFEVELIKVNPS